MKRIIISLLINLVGWLSKNQRTIGNAEKPLCSIKADDRFLYVVMPDGQTIPGQLNLNIEQPLKLRGLAIVKCTFFIKFDNLIQDEAN